LSEKTSDASFIAMVIVKQIYVFSFDVESIPKCRKRC